MQNQTIYTLLTGMLLFSIFGLTIETVFTGISQGWSGSFKGGVSLLMIPVYSLSYLLADSVLPKIQHSFLFKLPIRIPAIVVIIYTIEWISGAFYKSLNLTPWHYEHGWASDFSSGNITLLFLPAWIVFALIVVPCVQIIQKISPIILNELQNRR